VRDAERKLGVGTTSIVNSCQGKRTNAGHAFRYQDDDLAAAASQPIPAQRRRRQSSAPADTARWEKDVRALSAAVEALRVHNPRASFRDLQDTLESHGFIFGKNTVVPGRCDPRTTPPEHFPRTRDLFGDEYAANNGAIRSLPQLELYLERALGLCGEDAKRPRAETNEETFAPVPPPPPPLPTEPCAICLATIAEDACVLECGHAFHAGCLGEMADYVRVSAPTRRSLGVSCPLCRKVSRAEVGAEGA